MTANAKLKQRIEEALDALENRSAINLKRDNARGIVRDVIRELIEEFAPKQAPADRAKGVPPVCRFNNDRCGGVARYGPASEPVACWAHAGDWPEIDPAALDSGKGES